MRIVLPCPDMTEEWNLPNLPFTVWFTDINMPIVWLIVLGFYSRIFLVVPVLAKLPVGGPIEAWRAAFFIAGQYGVVSSARYIPLAIFWLAVLAEWYDYPEKIWRTVVTRLSLIVPLRTRLVVANGVSIW